MPSIMPIRAGAVAAAVVALLAMLTLTLAAHPSVADAAKKRKARTTQCRGADSQRLSLKRSNRVLFCLVNRERAKRGLRRLRDHRKLRRIARVHAKDMVRYQFIGHDSPKHGSLLRRMKRAKYGGKRGFSFGEILGAGSGHLGTPRAIVKEWMRRDIHKTAILHRKFRRMGVGGTRGMPSGNRKRTGRNFVITFGS